MIKICKIQYNNFDKKILESIFFDTQTKNAQLSAR